MSFMPRPNINLSDCMIARHFLFTPCSSLFTATALLCSPFNPLQILYVVFVPSQSERGFMKILTIFSFVHFQLVCALLCFAVFRKKTLEIFIDTSSVMSFPAITNCKLMFNFPSQRLQLELLLCRAQENVRGIENVK
jgi:hypothetical protein